MNLASRSIHNAPPHDPVERFRGSHLGILDGLAEFRRLPMLLEALKQARLTADATLALFDRQVLPHHVDEEHKLFAAALARAAGGAERRSLEDLIARLVAQHRHIEQLWTQLRPCVAAIAEGRAPASPAFRDEVVHLVEAYLDHTRLEERAFLPLADEILSRPPGQAPALHPAEHVGRGASGIVLPATAAGNGPGAAGVLEQLRTYEQGLAPKSTGRKTTGPE